MLIYKKMLSSDLGWIYIVYFKKQKDPWVESVNIKPIMHKRDKVTALTLESSEVSS